MAWTPGDPWPSPTLGGAQAPAWGDHIRFWVRAALASGNKFHMGPHTYDRLDAGNVMSGYTPALTGDGRAVTPVDRLWVDLTCDVLDVTITSGASGGRSVGIVTKVDAATLEVTLADPDGVYDPVNPVPPWTFAGHSRLMPGVPVEAFCEVVRPDGTWTRYPLFTGTADSWGEDWTPHPGERRAKLVATDATKTWVNLDRPEQPPAGAGDTTDQRVGRLVEFYDWNGTTTPAVDAPAVTLQATTFAQPGWELLNRTLDDELGIVYFTPDGKLRWVNRSAWFQRTPPVVVLGCAQATVPTARDILIDAEPSNLDLELVNIANIARTGGENQTARSDSSVERYGEYDYKRTDLGVETDVQAAEWAAVLVQLYSYPQVTLRSVTMLPAIDPASWTAWAAVLAVVWATDIVRVVWAPPDRPAAVVDLATRVVGARHQITRRRWEVTWMLIAAQAGILSGGVFHIGPDPADRLDAGFVLGF